MNNSFRLALVLGVVGLVVGYFLFGKVGGDYVRLTTLLNLSGGGIAGFMRNLAGIGEIRQNILLSGTAGAGVGVLVGLVSRRR